MPELEVACVQADDGWTCDVTVSDADGSTSRHTVLVTRAELDRYGDGHSQAQELVDVSFRFLLANEPKESILRRFALSDIERYFPTYAAAIAARLGR